MKPTEDRLHRVMVIGATPAGIAATNKLGELGIPVILVDSDPDIDRKLSNEEWRLKSGMLLNHAHRPGLIRIFRNPGIKCILPAQVNSIKPDPQGFSVSLTKHQTFVDPEKCILCGQCVEACPVFVNENEKAVRLESRLSLPGRPVIDKRRLPLCRKNCPLGVNAQGYIALAKQGKYIEALNLVREQNILPGICGRICSHPCENECRRNELDDAVSIRAIKRFLADYESENPDKIKSPEPVEKREEKIAVVGSGPAGLAAGAELARFGCQVTVFEKENMPGGLLCYGIGSHRLPRNILDAELDYIKKLGVEFVTSHPIDFDKDLENLSKDYNAVILSTGTWKDRMLGVPGENLEGVETCLSFLTKFYRGQIKDQVKNQIKDQVKNQIKNQIKDQVKDQKEKVAVIGDGNAAYDLARVLSRIGADVTIVSWFAKDEIPADPDEIKGANEEGIKLKDSTQVVEFLGNSGKFDTLLCKPTKPGIPDRNNNIAWPVIIENSEPFKLEFDRVFVAIGQSGALETSGKSNSLKISKFGFIETDESSGTNLPNIYAAGDAVTGSSSVVDAMAEGKKAAHRVLSDICKIQVPDHARRPEKDFPEISTDIPAQTRAAMPEKQLLGRKNNFSEVALGLPETQVIYEAQRCLQCGVCSECLECKEVCRIPGAINHEESEQEYIEHAGAIIIADPEKAPLVSGYDVIMAYDPESSDQDVYAMIMRGFASASEALILLGKTLQMQKGRGLSVSQPDPGLSPEIRIGVFACKCNESSGWLDSMDKYVQDLVSVEDVVHAEVLESACVPQGISSILRAVREKRITRIALASCVCCPLNFVCTACTDQRSRLKNALFTATGISRSMVETCNTRREALSLIKQGDVEYARDRFEGLIERSIKRARRLKPFPLPARIYNFTTAVIGESEAEVTTALTLAKAGKDVYMFGTKTSPLSITPEHPNIYCFKGSWVKELSGTLGDFQIIIESDGSEQTMQAGAVILGEKSGKEITYIHQKGLPSGDMAFSMQEKGVTGTPYFSPGMTSISGLFLADPPGIKIPKQQKGAGTAILAAAVMPRGPRLSKGFTVAIDEDLCRGCGRCMRICPYQAVNLEENSIGGWHARVDEAFCKGCGNCISVCPSNAADSPFRNQAFLEQSLEEILMQ